jgi:hypothetical protein
MQQQKSAAITIFLLGALTGCQSITPPRSAFQPPFSISPGGGALQLCGSFQLSVRDASLTPVPADSLRWSSSDSGVAPVSSGGLVRALQPSPGVTMRVAVHYNETQGSAQVTFLIIGLPEQQGSCPP